MYGEIIIKRKTTTYVVNCYLTKIIKLNKNLWETLPKFRKLMETRVSREKIEKKYRGIDLCEVLNLGTVDIKVRISDD